MPLAFMAQSSSDVLIVYSLEFYTEISHTVCLACKSWPCAASVCTLFLLEPWCACPCMCTKHVFQLRANLPSSDEQCCGLLHESFCCRNLFIFEGPSGLLILFAATTSLRDLFIWSDFLHWTTRLTLEVFPVVSTKLR